MNASAGRRRHLCRARYGVAAGRILVALLGMTLSGAAALAAPASQPADAIVPGRIDVRPTWGCLGVNWHFSGDANHNAAVQVEFRRKGTEAWRPALPLFLHDFEKTTMMSGSIFRLCPGTEYEVKLTLADPDGGSETRTVAAQTRDFPRMPSKGSTVESGGLAKAQELAQPGQVMVLAKGTYPAAALVKRRPAGQVDRVQGCPDGRCDHRGQT